MVNLADNFANLTQAEKIDLVYKAFSKLNAQDQVVILDLCRRLMRNMHKKHAQNSVDGKKLKFGEMSALELIAMFGVAIYDGRIKMRS